MLKRIFSYMKQYKKYAFLALFLHRGGSGAGVNGSDDYGGSD